MPKGLRRRYGLRHLHFITCSCYRRLPLFASARAKNLFVKILGEVRDRYGFALAGYVVMPNHIHLLIGEPAKGTPSTVMQVVKQRVSRRLRRNGGHPPNNWNCPSAILSNLCRGSGSTASTISTSGVRPSSLRSSTTCI